MADLLLHKGRERSVLNGHPWLFSGAIKSPLNNLHSGQVVDIFSADDELIAAGWFESAQGICIKLFWFAHLHPMQELEDLLRARLQRAAAFRKQYFHTTENNTYRLVHAEGDELPGLIIDVYAGDTAVIHIANPGWKEFLPMLTELLLAEGYVNQVLKHKSTDQQKRSRDYSTPHSSEGFNAESIITLENNIRFKVDAVNGQKTGFFIDQREARAYLQSLCKGKSVLNTFCYSGGFSAYALAGGANKITSVDISQDAIALTRENMALNQALAQGEVEQEAIAADCFNYLRDDDSLFDIVVLDPPAFAKNAHSVNNAARGYKELIMQGAKRCKKGGILFTFSCSQHIDSSLFRKITYSAMADLNRSAKIIKILGQPADHPVSIYHPEGEYLKGLVLQLD